MNEARRKRREREREWVKRKWRRRRENGIGQKKVRATRELTARV